MKGENNGICCNFSCYIIGGDDLKLLLLSFVFLLSGCTAQSGNEDAVIKPTPESILDENPEADILYKGSTVYKNASEIGWVMESGFSKGEEIGIVTKQTKKPEWFEHLTATQLLVGTKLYEAEDVNGDVIIAETEEGDIPYLGLNEG